MLSNQAASQISDSLRASLALRGSATVAVSPGPAVLRTLAALAAEPLPWDRIRFLLADEFRGAPSDPESGYRRVYDAFFIKIGCRPGHVLRFWSEGDPPEEVAAYFGRMVREMLGLAPGEFPRIDLVLLEAALDGSVGAFTPGSPALDPGTEFARPVETREGIRYTITGDAVRGAREVIVLRAGGVEDSPVLGILRPVDGRMVLLECSETGADRVASDG